MWRSERQQPTLCHNDIGVLVCGHDQPRLQVASDQSYETSLHPDSLRAASGMIPINLKDDDTINDSVPTMSSEPSSNAPRRAPTAPMTGESQRPTRFPPSIRAFPRREWRGTIPSPPFAPGDFKMKAQWAGRAASRRWAAALEKQSLEGMTTVDFAVAVADKAAEM